VTPNKPEKQLYNLKQAYLGELHMPFLNDLNKSAEVNRNQGLGFRRN